jgi:hypothetical protein
LKSDSKLATGENNGCTNKYHKSVFKIIHFCFIPNYPNVTFKYDVIKLYVYLAPLSKVIAMPLKEKRKPEDERERKGF